MSLLSQFVEGCSFSFSSYVLASVNSYENELPLLEGSKAMENQMACFKFLLKLSQRSLPRAQLRLLLLLLHTSTTNTTSSTTTVRLLLLLAPNKSSVRCALY